MAFSKDIGATYARNAGADLSGNLYYAAVVDTDGDLILAGAADDVVGIIIEAAEQDKPVTVQFAGIVKAIAGGTFNPGTVLASTSTGKLDTASGGQSVVGQALEPGVANAIVAVMLTLAPSP